MEEGHNLRISPCPKGSNSTFFKKNHKKLLLTKFVFDKEWKVEMSWMTRKENLITPSQVFVNVQRKDLASRANVFSINVVSWPVVFTRQERRKKHAK